MGDIDGPKEEVYFPVKFLPVLSSQGRLKHGTHEQLDLGRPTGSCAGNVGLQAVGRVLLHDSTLDSLGECCDLCVQTPQCTAWNFENNTCSIIDTVEDNILWSSHDHAFAGLNIKRGNASSVRV